MVAPRYTVLTSKSGLIQKIQIISKWMHYEIMIRLCLHCVCWEHLYDTCWTVVMIRTNIAKNKDSMVFCGYFSTVIPPSPHWRWMLWLWTHKAMLYGQWSHWTSPGCPRPPSIGQLPQVHVKSWLCPLEMCRRTCRRVLRLIDFRWVEKHS